MNAELRFVEYDHGWFKPKMRWHVTAQWKGNIYSSSMQGFKTQEEAREWIIGWLTNIQAQRRNEIVDTVVI